MKIEGNIHEKNHFGYCGNQSAADHAGLAAEKAQKGSREVHSQELSMAEMNKIAEQYVKKLQKAMPELKRYPFQTVIPSSMFT